MDEWRLEKGGKAFVLLLVLLAMLLVLPIPLLALSDGWGGGRVGGKRKAL